MAGLGGRKAVDDTQPYNMRAESRTRTGTQARTRTRTGTGTRTRTGTEIIVSVDQRERVTHKVFHKETFGNTFYIPCNSAAMRWRSNLNTDGCTD